MSCSWSEPKKIIGPIGYSLLHAALLTGFALSCRSIVNDDNVVFAVFFWICAFSATVAFFITHFRDPGFLKQDNPSIKDKRGKKEDSVKSSKHDSGINLNGGDSRNQSLHGNLGSDSKDNSKEKATSRDQVQFKRIKMAESITNSTTNLNTNANTGKLSTMERSTQDVGIPKTQVHSKEDEMQKMEGGNVPKDGNKGSIHVACEPSIVEKDEGEESSSEDFEGRINWKEKSREGSDLYGDDLVVEGGEVLSLKHKANSFSCKKVIKENNVVRTYKTVQTEDDEHIGENKKRKSAERQLFQIRVPDSERKEERGSANHQDQTADMSCNIPLQTGDEDSSKEIKMREMNFKLEKFSFHSLVQSFTSRNNKGLFNSFLKVSIPFESPISQKEPDIGSISPPSEDTNPTGREGKNKENGMAPARSFGSPRENKVRENIPRNIEIQIDEKSPNDNILPIEGERLHTEMVYVEKRYCTVCNIEQPFRSKHCKDCNRCVAKYDHHCPWLGNCIGERNHFWFYWFIVFQIAEIVLGQIQLYQCVFERPDESELYWKIIVLAVSTVFLIMTTMIFFLHTYLIIANLSTWESMSWNKITYLSDWPKKWGSPFSKGVFGNLKYFCCQRSNRLVEWQMPKWKKPHEKQTKDTL